MARVRDRLRGHLRVLVEEVGARPPGSPANAAACAYVARVLDGCGLDVVARPFTTRWWEPGPGRVVTARDAVHVLPDPYSPACDVRGRVARVERLTALESLESLEALEAREPAGAARERVLVLDGELAAEPVLPEAFPFLDVPEHARLRAALRRLRPAAVLAVTDHEGPILEDPDLGLPSTTLLRSAAPALPDGARVRVTLGGAVHEGSGTTISARHGPSRDRVVLTAHVDSKATTPGAVDNAAGVAVLLALAQDGVQALGGVELALLNGEDHVDACGQVAWLEATDLDEVAACLNVDGVGLGGGGTSLATLACLPEVERAADAWVASRPGWVRAEPWLAGDHALFAARGIPALAVTSEDAHRRLAGVAHTPRDTLDLLDLPVLEDVVAAVPALIGLLRAGPR